jgi:hypothetical protein
MKRTLLIISVLGVGLIVLLGSQLASEVVVEKEVIEKEVIKEVVVDNVEARVKEAQATAMIDIEARAEKIKNDFIANELKTIEAQVLKDVETELRDRRTQVEKETGAF